MATAREATPQAVVLRNEVMLQINQRLFDSGIISKDVYEQAKIKIVSST